MQQVRGGRRGGGGRTVGGGGGWGAGFGEDRGKLLLQSLDFLSPLQVFPVIVVDFDRFAGVWGGCGRRRVGGGRVHGFWDGNGCPIHGGSGCHGMRIHGGRGTGGGGGGGESEFKLGFEEPDARFKDVAFCLELVPGGLLCGRDGFVHLEDDRLESVQRHTHLWSLLHPVLLMLKMRG